MAESLCYMVRRTLLDKIVDGFSIKLDVQSGGDMVIKSTEKVRTLEEYFKSDKIKELDQSGKDFLKKIITKTTNHEIIINTTRIKSEREEIKKLL